MIKRDVKVYENGLKHIHYHIPFLKSVCMDFFVRVGSSSESRREQWGIAHFLEHMVFNGSSKYPDPNDSKYAATEIGANENAWTWIDMTQYYTIVRKDYIAKGFDILFDRVYAPLLRDSDVKKEQGIILEERKRSDSNPMSKLDERLDRIMFDGEVYNHPVLGYSDTISGINSKLLKEFHKLYYSANNSYFISYGGVTFEEITEIVSKDLASLHSSDIPKLDLATDPNAPDNRETDVSMPTDSSIYSYRNASPTIKDLDSYVTAVIFGALAGGGDASKVHQELVAKSSLASVAESYVLPARSYLLSGVDVSTKQENLPEVRKLTQEVMQSIVEGNVTKEEFERARNFSLGEFTRAVEDVSFPTNLNISNSALVELFTGVDLDVIAVQESIKNANYEDTITRFKDLFAPARSIEGTLTPLEK